MCARTNCNTCGKPTWSGCGRHIESALRGVPVDQRCSCRESASTAAPTTSAPRGSIFGSLFGGNNNGSR